MTISSQGFTPVVGSMNGHDSAMGPRAIYASSPSKRRTTQSREGPSRGKGPFPIIIIVLCFKPPQSTLACSVSHQQFTNIKFSKYIINVMCNILQFFNRYERIASIWTDLLPAAAPESCGGLEHLIYSCPPDGFFRGDDLDGSNTDSGSARGREGRPTVIIIIPAEL